MFLLSPPDESAVDDFLASCGRAHLSYNDVGMSKTGRPESYNSDHNRILLGHGSSDFEKAKEAVRRWKMFDIPWVKLWRPGTKIETGHDVAVVVDHFGFYSLNGCRIVYTIDEAGSVNRFGFAYGTLTDHSETGEERFSVEHYVDSEEVWYDLYALSQPRHILAKFAYPLSRMLQKRFAAGSLGAMKRFVNR